MKSLEYERRKKNPSSVDTIPTIVWSLSEKTH